MSYILILISLIFFKLTVQVVVDNQINKTHKNHQNNHLHHLHPLYPNHHHVNQSNNQHQESSTTINPIVRSFTIPESNDHFKMKTITDVDRSIAIIFTTNCTKYCGGVFIGPTIIVTTASCIQVEMKNIRIYPNIDNMLPECNWDQIPYPIHRIYHHPSHQQSTNYANIALIVLFNAVNQFIEPIEIATANGTINDEILWDRQLPSKLSTRLWPFDNVINGENTIINSGSVINQRLTTISLKKFTTRLIESSACSLFKPNIVPIQTFCGYFEMEKVNCFNQEGFPVIYEQSVDHAQSKRYLLGLIANNPCDYSPNYLCPLRVTLYINVINFLPWLKAVTDHYRPSTISTINGNNENPVNIVYNVNYNSNNAHLLLDSHDELINNNISYNNQQYSYDSHNDHSQLNNMINISNTNVINETNQLNQFDDLNHYLYPTINTMHSQINQNISNISNLTNQTAIISNNQETSNIINHIDQSMLINKHVNHDHIQNPGVYIAQNDQSQTINSNYPQFENNFSQNQQISQSNQINNQNNFNIDYSYNYFDDLGTANDNQFNNPSVDQPDNLNYDGQFDQQYNPANYPTDSQNYENNVWKRFKKWKRFLIKGK